MKRKTGQDRPKLVKTSISLPDVLVKFAEQQIGKEGFNSLSAYLAHLVRLDKAEKEGAISRSPAQYPPHRDEFSRTEDKPGAPAPLSSPTKETFLEISKKAASGKTSPPK